MAKRKGYLATADPEPQHQVGWLVPPQPCFAKAMFSFFTTDADSFTVSVGSPFMSLSYRV